MRRIWARWSMEWRACILALILGLLVLGFLGILFQRVGREALDNQNDQTNLLILDLIISNTRKDLETIQWDMTRMAEGVHEEEKNCPLARFGLLGLVQTIEGSERLKESLGEYGGLEDRYQELKDTGVLYYWPDWNQPITAFVEVGDERWALAEFRGHQLFLVSSLVDLETEYRQTFVIGSNGIVMHHSNTDLVGLDYSGHTFDTHLGPLAFSYAFAQGVPVKLVHTLGGVDRTARAIPLPELGVAIGIVDLENGSFQMLMDMLWKERYPLSLLVVGCLFVVYWLSSLGMAPLRRLGEYAQKILKGEISDLPAIEGTEEVQSLQKAFTELLRVRRKEQVESIGALAQAIEAKDPYTAGHSERVAMHAEAMGNYWGFEPHERERLRQAALLHDIGKIGVPEKILQKHGPLSEEEWEQIKKHPVKSGEILGRAEYLSDLVPIVRSHHERYDGNGYPDGLAGKKIPLEARIIAVADAYDAMTTSRPYRSKLTPEEAVREICRGAGSQFDPSVVEVFLMLETDVNSVRDNLGVGKEDLRTRKGGVS